jgi:hypothetical protein
MPEANSDPILSNSPARLQTLTPDPAHKPKLLSHNDAKATKIYTHVLNRGPEAVRNPMDGLQALGRGVLDGPA